MAKSVSYSYKFGSTCPKCGNEFERVKLYEQKSFKSNIEKETTSIPICRQCRVVKEGLGEDLETIRRKPINPMLSNLIKLSPMIVGILVYYVFIQFVSLDESNEYLGYIAFFAAAVITYIITVKLGLQKKTIDKDDLFEYMIDEFDIEDSSDDIIVKLKQESKAHIEISRYAHFDRYDLFETYLKLQDKEERFIYVVQGDNLSEEDLQFFKFTKNRFAKPYAHILLFDNYNNKVYYKSSIADMGELEERIYFVIDNEPEE